MKTYIGTKIIKAEEGQYCEFYIETGKDPLELYHQANIPRNLQSIRELTEGQKYGYKVEYEDGYISWSPKDVFEKAYVEMDQNLAGAICGMADKIMSGNWASKDAMQTIRDAVEEGVKLGKSFSYIGTLPKTEQLQYVAAELEPITATLETIKERGRYIVAGYEYRIFIDINIENDNTTEVVYGKIFDKWRERIRGKDSIKNITRL